MIVFIATWAYIRERRTRYLWWFTIGLVLMFATMEASFIYIAIFGSFLVVRLLALVIGAPWVRDVLPRLRTPLLVALAGVILVGAGLSMHQFMGGDTAPDATATATSDTFAADPNATTTPEVAPTGPTDLGLPLGLRTCRAPAATTFRTAAAMYGQPARR